MSTWQRRARLVLGVFVVAFAVVVFFAIRRRAPEAPPAPVARTDPAAVAEATRGNYNELKGTTQPYRLHYEKLLTYEDGRTRLVGVQADVDRGGRAFTIAAREAEVGKDQAFLVMRGDVHLASNDGLDVRAQEATYSAGEGIVRAPGAVTFSRGATTGTAVGMMYDEHRDVVWLLDQVVVAMPAEDGAPATDVTAGAAGWARADRYLRFERGVKMVRGERTLEAEAATAYLTDDGQSLRLIEARGRSQVTAAAGSPGSFEAMHANDMNLAYGAGGEALERATLAGAAGIAIAGEAGGASRELAADWLDLGFEADGTTVRSISGHDHVQLDLPAAAGAPARTIRSAGIQGQGRPGRGLTAVRFTGDPGRVEYRETRAGAAEPRTATARVLDVTMKPGFGDVERAVFSDGADFAEGALQGTAREARYDVAGGVVVLAGERDGRPPQIVQERATIVAASIAITLEGKQIAATGSVRSVLRPPATGRAGGAPADAAKVPGLLKQDEATTATADAMTYDGSAGQAVYTGTPARLWQAETTITAGEIRLDEDKGDLHASGSVVTAMGFDQTDAKTKKTERVQSVARAQTLRYEDASRRATYTGGAQMSGPQGHLVGDTIEVYLREGGGALERIDANGTVTVKPEGRVVTGDRLRYVAADEQYVMTGTPVTITEECRETKGKTLTFWKSADRIIVDGNEQTRTQTKGGAKCGEPRFD